jgi:ABC-type multidrug transport system permease subunit
MRSVAGLLAVVFALSLIAFSGAATVSADGPDCYYLSTQIGGAAFSDTGWSPALAFQAIPWPGGTQSDLTQVTTAVYSTSWGVLAASYVQYDLPGFFALITIGNLSPISGTVYYWVCFS